MVNVVKPTQASVARAEKEWREYWEQYCKEYPDADCEDYRDEHSMFMQGIFGGIAKHW